MKIEKSSFTPNHSQTIVVLNDLTMTPNKIIFWIDGAYPSHGYDDGTTAVCGYNTSSTKTDKSIHSQNGSTVIMSGRISYFDEGEFEVDFSNWTYSTINYLAIEE